MRLNHYLARAGVAARRKADQLIAAGQVVVNGEPAGPGQSITPGVDRVMVDGRPVSLPERSTYLLLNKPAGVLTSVGDDRGRQTVTDRLPRGTPRVFPVGRLDLESRGLVLLTNDGELAMRLMHPRYHVEKEYRVRIAGRPTEQALRQLSEGMVVRGEPFAPAQVRVLASDPSSSLVAMVLQEGRKREIRRLWESLGHRVLDLQRVRIDGVELGGQAEGTTRPLQPDEVERLRTTVGL